MSWRLFFSLLAVLAIGVSSARAAPEVVKTSCNEAKTALFYQDYGLVTPEEWTCTFMEAQEKAPLVIWKKGEKAIVLGEEKFDSADNPLRGKNIQYYPDPDAKEPERTIRYLFETLLMDEKAVGRNEFMKNSARANKASPSALLFGHNRKQVVFTQDLGNVAFRNHVRPAESVVIYKIGQTDRYLNIICYSCELEDVIPKLVGPALI